MGQTEIFFTDKEWDQIYSEKKEYEKREALFDDFKDPDNGFLSSDFLMKEFAVPEDVFETINEKHIYQEVSACIDHYNERNIPITDEVISRFEKQEADSKYMRRQRLGGVIKELQALGYKWEYERKKEAKQKHQENMLKKKNELLNTLEIPEETYTENIQKTFFLDKNIISLCTGENTSKLINDAIIEYADNPAEDVKSEIKKIPMQNVKKAVRLTIDKNTWDILDKLCNGQRLATAIMEVAVWRYMKHGND